MLRKRMLLDGKAVSDDGLFAGYGSVFGVVDSYREIVAPGAFAESLATIKAKGRPVPVLWEHHSDKPLGVYENLVEDRHGLKVEGRLLHDSVALAKETYALMKVGAVSGLSIGYYVREDSYDEKERLRILKKLDLVEISLVTFPACDDARVDSIKSRLAQGDLPSFDEFVRFLEDGGFPPVQASRIASEGFKSLISGGSKQALSALRAAVDNFSFTH